MRIPPVIRRSLFRWIPVPLKKALEESWWGLRVDSVMREIMRTAPGAVPDTSLLNKLATEWGNEGYSAHDEYLQEVAHQAATTEGSILECGTGLTTLVLASIAGRRGVRVCSLEHDREWFMRVSRRLSAVGLDTSTITLAPLHTYNGYAWYDPPASAVPANIKLVVCDGPPGETLGGRYGLLPRMRSRLAPGALILVDDAGRDDEATIVNQWLREGCSLVTPPKDQYRSYAIISYTSQS